jgi:pyruvate/2-oxoglutarate dehydrogenase complex dihydrolipoamide acyltransferase (E2) component
MPTKVLVPRLGEGVEEITITKWLKQEGDSVRELEPLLEVNTDKVDTEIPSPATGTLLKIEMQEGQLAKVGEVLALISTADEITDKSVETDSTKPDVRKASRSKTKTDALDQTSEAPRSTVHRPPSTANHDLGFISPLVAKIAAEHGIDLQLVKGSGLGGRITKEDVLAFVESGKSVKEQISKLVDQETGKLFSEPANLPATNLPGTDALIQHTAIRKQIARHMLASKQTSPHVLTVMEADMSKVIAHQSAYKETFARDGINLTYTVYFMAAIAAGLKSFPIVNSSWSEQGILVHPAINIGMATSLGEEGLIVPVIRNADGLSLPDLARAVNDLTARARAKKLRPDEVQGGTFTLTNHGVSGSLLAMPIINQPQCGILGTGALQKRAVVINDAIAIRPMVYLSFVFDHRILDGTSADHFLASVKERLENWI